MHLGGLLDLPCTRVSLLLPFALAVCVCANAAVVLQQARLRGPQPCQPLPPQDPRSVHRTEEGLTQSLFIFLPLLLLNFLPQPCEATSTPPHRRAGGTPQAVTSTAGCQAHGLWESRQEEPESRAASTHCH